MDNQKQMIPEPSQPGSAFSYVPTAPPDPILGTFLGYMKDTSSDKINLGIGAYRDGEGKPYVFKAVKAAEEIVSKRNHGYVNDEFYSGIPADRWVGRFLYRS